MCRKLVYYAVLWTVALLFVGCAKEKHVESVAEPANTTLAVYPYTTNDCVYVNTSTGIEQYAKNGTKVGSLKLKDAEILFVDKSWLYYSISDGSADGVEIYRIPICTEGGKDVITYGDEEKILTERDGIATDGAYVKGAYLVYITNYHEYKKYNLESSEFKKAKRKKANCTWGNEDNFNDSVSEEAAYLLYDEKGIYRQNFQDDSLCLVERELPVCSLTVTPKGVFYIVGEGGEEQIKVYDEEQNESTVFIDAKQMKQEILSAQLSVQEKTAKDMFYLDDLFISGNRLFIETVLYGENASDEETESVIFSCSLDDASDLVFEKNLINCMKKLSTVSKGYDFDIQKVINGNILFTFYDETESEKLGCYNLKSGAAEEIRTGETKEWLLQYYNSQSGIDLSNRKTDNNISLGTSADDLKDGSKEDSEDTDEYFVEKYSIYRNPIDKYFWLRIYSWDASQAEIREAQKAYKKAWKAEYRNMMKWLKKKCVYNEDKKNIRLLEKEIADQIDIEKKVMKTELINAYKTNPDSSQDQNSISRISLLGHGTQERLAQSEGELYRDVCMRILNLHGGEGGYEFKFHEAD